MGDAVTNAVLFTVGAVVLLIGWGYWNTDYLITRLLHGWNRHRNGRHLHHRVIGAILAAPWRSR